MKKMLLELLVNLNNNCEGICTNEGEPVRADIDNIIDIVKSLPSDSEMESLKNRANLYSWTEFPDRMGGQNL